MNDSFANSDFLGSLHQRNFGSDYFTEALTSPQRGNVQKVQVSSNEFSISALRQANSLQQYMERNNLAGFRLQDYVRANYGADLNTQYCLLHITSQNVKPDGLFILGSIILKNMLGKEDSERFRSVIPG